MLVHLKLHPHFWFSAKFGSLSVLLFCRTESPSVICSSSSCFWHLTVRVEMYLCNTKVSEQVSDFLDSSPAQISSVRVSWLSETFIGISQKNWPWNKHQEFRFLCVKHTAFADWTVSKGPLHVTVKHYFLVTFPGSMPAWSSGMAGNVASVNDI